MTYIYAIGPKELIVLCDIKKFQITSELLTRHFTCLASVTPWTTYNNCYSLIYNSSILFPNNTILITHYLYTAYIKHFLAMTMPHVVVLMLH